MDILSYLLRPHKSIASASSDSCGVVAMSESAPESRARGATRAAEIAIVNGDPETAEDALLEALGQVRKMQYEGQQ